METFNAIPIFVAVAELQGFSAAARELGLSKSAISKRITQLEEQLGVRLIHRSTRQLSLTEAGERYYEFARLAAGAARNAEDAVAELQGEPTGLLKILAPMSFGQLHIAPLIPEFLKAYPKVRIDLVLDDRPLNLIEEGFDLAIRAGSLPDSTLIARRLATLNSIVCCSPDYLEKHQETLRSPFDLKDHNCVLYSYSDNADHWQFSNPENRDESYSVKVQGNFSVNNSEALKSAIAKGLGIGRLPTFVAARGIEDGSLAALFREFQMPGRDMFVIYPERNYLPLKVKVFADFTHKCFGEQLLYWEQSL